MRELRASRRTACGGSSRRARCTGKALALRLSPGTPCSASMNSLCVRLRDGAGILAHRGNGVASLELSTLAREAVAPGQRPGSLCSACGPCATVDQAELLKATRRMPAPSRRAAGLAAAIGLGDRVFTILLPVS